MEQTAASTEVCRSNAEGGNSIPALAVLLVAKSAFAAAPHAEMRRLVRMASLLPGVAKAVACFSEQGQPSLRDALLDLLSFLPHMRDGSRLAAV